MQAFEREALGQMLETRQLMETVYVQRTFLHSRIFDLAAGSRLRRANSSPPVPGTGERATTFVPLWR